MERRGRVDSFRAWRSCSPTSPAPASARRSTSTREAGPDDVPGAAAIRLANLRAYLAERAGADVVALGEAAGYQGMRWSGIAFTSERDLARWGDPYRPTLCGPALERAVGHDRAPGAGRARRRAARDPLEHGADPPPPAGRAALEPAPDRRRGRGRRRVRPPPDRARPAARRWSPSAGSRSRSWATGRPTCATPPTAAARRSPRECARSWATDMKRGQAPLFTLRVAVMQRPFERVGERPAAGRDLALEPGQALAYSAGSSRCSVEM